jgi:hypothetical protein
MRRTPGLHTVCSTDPVSPSSVPQPGFRLLVPRPVQDAEEDSQRSPILFHGFLPDSPVMAASLHHNHSRPQAAEDSSANGSIGGHSSDSPSPALHQPAKRRKHKREEPTARRQAHAAANARRRSAISSLHSTLARVVTDRTSVTAVTTEHALQQAIHLIQQEASSTTGDTRLLSTQPSHLLPSSSSSSSSPTLDRAPCPLSFSNSHIRQLSKIMDWALEQYQFGAAFNPSYAAFHTSPALQAMIAAGGSCGILSADMRRLDWSHDVSDIPFSQRAGTRPGDDCILRLSESTSEVPLTYRDLAHKLDPVFREMVAGSFPSSSSSSSSTSALSSSDATNACDHNQLRAYRCHVPEMGRRVRSLKMMTLLRHIDGRPPVLLGVRLSGTVCTLD